AVHVAVHIADPVAPGERTGPGPRNLTRWIVRNHPAAVATAMGSATSSTAFEAIPRGPTPREESIAASVRRRSSQYTPTAATTSRATNRPANETLAAGLRILSTVSMTCGTTAWMSDSVSGAYQAPNEW